MVERKSSDEESTPEPHVSPVREPMGYAALILAESVIHELVASRAIGVVNALELVGVAIDVIREKTFDDGDHDGESRGSLVLLERIRASLAIDLIV